MAEPHGIRLLDCPVTGGVEGANAGTLTLFASGDEYTVDTARPVLASAGILHVVGSRPGEGQAVKLVNQKLASIHLAADAEAMAFAERLGLDQAGIRELLLTGPAASWMLADRGPRMALSREVRPVATRLSLFVKDSELVADAAAAVHARAPSPTAARHAWVRAAELGLDQGDDSGIIDAFR